jgi:hypothetical protein
VQLDSDDFAFDDGGDCQLDDESMKAAKALAAKVKKARHDKSIRENRQENRRKKLRGGQAAPVSDAGKRRTRIEKNAFLTQQEPRCETNVRRQKKKRKRRGKVPRPKTV